MEAAPLLHEQFETNRKLLSGACPARLRTREGGRSATQKKVETVQQISCQVQGEIGCLCKIVIICRKTCIKLGQVTSGCVKAPSHRF